MFEEDIEELKAKTMCTSCVEEEYLSDEIAAHGNRSKCSYCGETGRNYSVGKISFLTAVTQKQPYECEKCIS